mmetsp:Transcript_28692/g.58705  ORF Transcript_28692/g.58705 Transcript_28692/m.58705 type:complete len:978 (+) Transcript_28692:88-3021(+)
MLNRSIQRLALHSEFRMNVPPKGWIRTKSVQISTSQSTKSEVGWQGRSTHTNASMAKTFAAFPASADSSFPPLSQTFHTFKTSSPGAYTAFPLCAARACALHRTSPLFHHAGSLRFISSTSATFYPRKPTEDNDHEEEAEEQEEKNPEQEESTTDPSTEVESTEVMVQRTRGDILSSNTTQLVRSDPNWTPKEVLVIPVFRRPIFPGIATPIALTNPEFCDYMLKLKNETGSHPHIGLFLTKEKHVEEGKLIQDLSEIHEIGCLGQIVHVQGVQQLGMQLLVAGAGRILITGIIKKEPFLTVSVERLPDKAFDPHDKIIKAWMLEVMSTLKSIVKLEHLFKEQLQTILNQVDVSNPGLLADITTSMTTADRESLQKVLECLDVQERLSQTLRLLKIELEQAEMQKSIHKQMEENVSKMQRKHFLTEQLKIIKKELGMEVDEKEDLIQKMTEKLAGMTIPAAPEKVIQEQLKKLSLLEASSPEFNITRTYLDWLVGLPWSSSTEENLDVNTARVTLDEDHYGMADVKDRILEFIAVGALKGTVQGKIICFYGPPGVGKTSIGKSIATALNRKFFRFAVGGMTDVSEIKGHRRTYVGAMPGKLVQALKYVGSNNPVIVLDEIDKLGRGYQGDPASALLEVLDPAQNHEFLDHYLDVPIDLSQVLFICTANSLDTVPGPLKDRMEVIPVSGYTAEDKVEIAKRHLIPSAGTDNGIPHAAVTIRDEALSTLINKYCREPGVRNLQKQIEKLLRKCAYKIATKAETSMTIEDSNLDSYVGPPVFAKDRIYDLTPPGVVMGLAWTAMGGTTLYIESVITSGAEKASLRCTGQMGDVMKESSDIAFSFARRFLRELDPSNNRLEDSAVHLHIPEGATPKDGPSAGVTMITALLSLALNTPAAQTLAMTGEVSLTGKVLPVGGIKEKVLAAQRAGVESIVLPADNRRDWEELEERVRGNSAVFFATHYRDVFEIAFPSLSKKKST